MTMSANRLHGVCTARRLQDYGRKLGSCRPTAGGNERLLSCIMSIVQRSNTRARLVSTPLHLYCSRHCLLLLLGECSAAAAVAAAAAPPFCCDSL